MAIVIEDMEMPESCGKCKFMRNTLNSGGICIVGGVLPSPWPLKYEQRGTPCPIKKIVQVDVGVFLEGHIETFNPRED